VQHHGRIAELGSHAELMAIDGGLYRRLYELQQLEDEPPQAG
jgi:ATP-binding cassette subfamily B multidrug efflux pump